MTDIIWKETEAPRGWYRARCSATGDGLPDATTLHSGSGPHPSHGEALTAHRGARHIVTVDDIGAAGELGRACAELGAEVRGALLAELEALHEKAADHERLRDYWAARAISAGARLEAAEPGSPAAKKASKSLHGAKELTRRHDADARATRRAHRTRAAQLGMEA